MIVIYNYRWTFYDYSIWSRPLVAHTACALSKPPASTPGHAVASGLGVSLLQASTPQVT